MYCRNCGKELPAKAVACIGCGMDPNDGYSHCSACGANTKERQVICTECGESLERSGVVKLNKIFNGINEIIGSVEIKESRLNMPRTDVLLVIKIVLLFVLGIMFYVWLFLPTVNNPVSGLGVMLVTAVIAFYAYAGKNYIKGHEAAEVIDTKGLLVLVGSVIFFIGIFAPISSWSKTWNYFGLLLVGRGDALIIVLLAIALLVFAYRKLYIYTYLTGVVCLACLLYTFNQKLSETMLITDGYGVLKKAYDLLGETPDMPPSPELRFGWLLLFGGLGLIAVSAIYKESEASNSVRNIGE